MAGALFRIVWALPSVLTYVVLVVDVWRGPHSTFWKIVICLLWDPIAAAFWPLCWIIWIVGYFVGSPTPITSVFGW